MKITELRLGNWIKGNGIKFQVNRDLFSIMKDNDNRFEGIPLNEDYFEDFGFKLHKKQLSLNVDGELFYYAQKDEFLIWKNDSYIGKKGWTLEEKVNMSTRYINYVHELQNLYFAMTGEELEFIVEK